jgi:hypothetical protein
VWTAEFGKAVAERAVSTFAQALVAVLSADGLDIVTAPWWSALSTAGLAAVLSVLKSVAVNQYQGGGPSLTTERLAIDDRPGRHARPE